MGDNLESEKSVQIKGLLDPGGTFVRIWRAIRQCSRTRKYRQCPSPQDATLRTLLPTSNTHHQMIWPWKRLR